MLQEKEDVLKIVINREFGGFDLSKEAKEYLIQNGLENYDEDSIEFRTDKRLIECVENLGVIANGDCANLEILEIPKHEIQKALIITEYDGWERVEEVHNFWG